MSRVHSPAPPEDEAQRSSSSMPGRLGLFVAVVAVVVVHVRYPWVTVQQAAVAVGSVYLLAVAAAFSAWRRRRRASRPDPDDGDATDLAHPDEDGDRLIPARREATTIHRFWMQVRVAGAILAGSAGGGWLLWTVAPLALWTLCATLLVALIVWKAVQRRPPAAPHGEDNSPVKSAGPGEWCEAVGKGWPAAARAAALTVDDEGKQPLEPTEPPSPNGVGGVLIKLDLGQAQLTPTDLQRATDVITRRLRAPYVYVMPRGGPGRIDDVHLHLYRGFPLYGHTVGYQWLQHAAATVGEGNVPVGITVTGDPAELTYRYSTLITALPDSGKTHQQLAGLAGLAAAGVHTDLYLVDNRGKQGGREFEPLRPVSTFYGQTVAEAFAALRLVRIELHDRNRRLPPGDQIPASRFWPLKLLVITEHQAFVASSPPTDAEVQNLGFTWDQYTLGEFSARPDRSKWRGLVDEWLYELGRIGRAVLCVFWSGAHASLIETLGRHRDAISQRILFRLLEEGGIDAALGHGAVAAGAAPHLIPEGSDAAGIGYLRRQTSRPVLFRSAYIPYRDLQAAIVIPFRRLRQETLATATSNT